MRKDSSYKKKAVRKRLVLAGVLMAIGIICAIALVIFSVLSYNLSLSETLGDFETKSGIAFILLLFFLAYGQWRNAGKLRNEIQVDELIEQKD